MSERDIWNRFGALSGAAFCILAIVGFAISGSSGKLPVELSSKTTTISIVTESDSSVAGAYLVLLSVFFLFIFLSYLRSRLQQVESEEGWLSTVSFGGGLVVASMLLFYAGFSVSENVMPTLFGSTRVTEMLLELKWGPIFMLAPPLAALIGGGSAVALRSNLLPGWLAVPGILLTAMLLVPYAWYPAFLAFFPWLLAVSIALYKSSDQIG